VAQGVATPADPPNQKNSCRSTQRGGQDHLRKKKLQKELADLDKEARKIDNPLMAIERRRAELNDELDG